MIRPPLVVFCHVTRCSRIVSGTEISKLARGTCQSRVPRLSLQCDLSPALDDVQRGFVVPDGFPYVLCAQDDHVGFISFLEAELFYPERLRDAVWLLR
jgi:hypothetical protein